MNIFEIRRRAVRKLESMPDTSTPLGKRLGVGGFARGA